MITRLFQSWPRLKNRAAALPAAEHGVAAVEFSMFAPMILLLMLGATTFFLIGREGYRSQRATYVAADIVARQSSVNDAFLQLVRTMSQRIATSDARAIEFRVTSATNDGTAMIVDWSYGDSAHAKETKLDRSALRIPEIAKNDSLVIVETSVAYQPAFLFAGASAGKHRNASFARPRSVAKVTKS